MDIPELSMSMASSKLARDVGTSMMKKSLDQVELVGEQIVEMIESVPSYDGLVDISV